MTWLELEASRQISNSKMDKNQEEIFGDMRKEGLENLMHKGHKDGKRNRKSVSNWLDKFMQMNGKISATKGRENS